MADPDLSSPLIQHQSSHHSEVVISISDDDSGLNLPAVGDPRVSRCFEFDHRNPYGFLSESEPPVLGPTTVDPFRNNTPGVCGLYEAIKILICLPIALVRLVLFGASLAVGYLATKLALAGWKDKENPMPLWRCRIMWITRICTRCILFSFGSVLLLNLLCPSTTIHSKLVFFSRRLKIYCFAEYLIESEIVYREIELRNGQFGFEDVR